MRTRMRDLRIVSSVNFCSIFGRRASTHLPRAQHLLIDGKHEFVARLRRFALRGQVAQRVARHGAGYAPTLRQPFAIQRGDDLSRDSKRALDSQSNVRNDMGLDLKLAIAEKLE